ncbi:pectinesterase precursor [Fusarium acutatum]|uniref:Pectinesterase n=1 Tax=Fusarium acutatum TaxID=78861 RepID=A0A8H4NK40_9HYPO|nr:pectinesterase precursor [Fusarium acutatum]
MTLVPYSKQQLADCILMPLDPPTDTFHLFSNLPLEMRLKIWESALSNYRHIKVLVADENYWEFSAWNCHHERIFHVDDVDEKPYEVFVKKGATYHPLLNTTSESRNVAKKFYHKHNVGLFNLALNCELRHDENEFLISDNERLLFIEAIRRLEVLTFVGLVPNKCTQLLMYGSDLRVINKSPRLVDKHVQTDEYDRGSFNYKSGLYENELTAVYIGNKDPRRGYYSFCNLLQVLDIPEDVYKASEQFMLTYNCEPHCVSINGDPDEYRGVYNNAQRESREYSQEPPAVGFWLFPLSAIGPFYLDDLRAFNGLPLHPKEDIEVKDRVIDLSDCDSSFCFYHPAYYAPPKSPRGARRHWPDLDTGC